MKDSNEQRFSGDIGGENYDLFSLAVPDYSSQQKQLAKQVAHVPSNAGILEIGTGTGYTTRKLLEETNAHITTIDNDKRMVECAKRNFYYALRAGTMAVGNPSVQIYHASGFWQVMNNPRFVKRSYAGLVQAFTLHNLVAKERATLLKKATNLVRPGGTVAMLDKIARDDPAAHAKDLEDQIAAFSVYDSIGRPELREEWTRHYHEDNQPDRIWKESDALKQLRDLGFPDVRVVERYGMHALITGTKSEKK